MQFRKHLLPTHYHYYMTATQPGSTMTFSSSITWEVRHDMFSDCQSCPKAEHTWMRVLTDFLIIHKLPDSGKCLVLSWFTGERRITFNLPRKQMELCSLGLNATDDYGILKSRTSILPKEETNTFCTNYRKFLYKRGKKNHLFEVSLWQYHSGYILFITMCVEPHQKWQYCGQITEFHWTEQQSSLSVAKNVTAKYQHWEGMQIDKGCWIMYGECINIPFKHRKGE